MFREIILASSSPRRKELLEQVGANFKIIPSNLDEVIDKSMMPEKIAENLSYQKAMDIAVKIEKDYEPDKKPLVLGADTIVVKGGEILGKPLDKKDAFDMLKSLQGDWHEVITGITVVDCRNFQFESRFEKTKVKMRNFDNDTINRYIDTGDPMDKAGGYGIQTMGALLVEGIEGCYFNVVGLPLLKTSIILDKFGVKLI